MSKKEEEPANPKSGKLKSVPKKVLGVFKKTWLITLLLGLIIGGASVGYLRGRTIRYYKAQLSNSQTDLNNLRTDFDNSFVNEQSDCYDPISLSGSECPEIKVLSARTVNDQKLKSNGHFVIVQLDIENKNKSTISMEIGNFKLKDSNNYIYSPTSANAYFDGNEETKYESISGVKNLLDQYTLSISEGERIRGNLVYEVSDPALPYHVTYYKSKSNTFRP